MSAARLLAVSSAACSAALLATCERGLPNDPVAPRPTHERLLWMRVLPGVAGSSAPSLGPGGTVHVGTGAFHGAASGTDQLCSFESDGTLRWCAALTDVPYTSTVAPDGTVYAQGATGTIFAVSSAGVLRWSFAPLSPPGFTKQLTVALGADGTLYATSGTLLALAPDGTLVWSLAHEDVRAVWTSPVIGADGTLYVAAEVVGGSALLAITPDGTLLWRAPLEDADMFAAPGAIGADGTVYVGGATATERGERGALFAVSPEGVVRWVHRTGANQPFRSSPAVAADGTIYAGTAVNTGRDGGFIALSPEGAVRWQLTPENPIEVDDPDYVYPAPTLGADGTIYLALGKLYALAPDGSLRWSMGPGDEADGQGWYLGWGGASSAVAIADDGTLFVQGFSYGADDGSAPGSVLAVLRSESLGLADAPWPHLGGNGACTGRAAP